LKSYDLKTQGGKCKIERGQNSDIRLNEDIALEEIAEHLKTCKSCRISFDSMDFKEENTMEFSYRIENVNTWVC